jgi:hypothetical protein
MLSYQACDKVNIDPFQYILELFHSGLGNALKRVNISSDKLIAIVMTNGLSPLYGIADLRWAYPWTVGQSSQGIPQFPGALLISASSLPFRAISFHTI